MEDLENRIQEEMDKLVERLNDRMLILQTSISVLQTILIANKITTRDQIEELTEQATPMIKARMIELAKEEG